MKHEEYTDMSAFILLREYYHTSLYYCLVAHHDQLSIGFQASPEAP